MQLMCALWPALPAQMNVLVSCVLATDNAELQKVKPTRVDLIRLILSGKYLENVKKLEGKLAIRSACQKPVEMQSSSGVC